MKGKERAAWLINREWMRKKNWESRCLNESDREEDYCRLPTHSHTHTVYVLSLFQLHGINMGSAKATTLIHFYCWGTHRVFRVALNTTNKDMFNDTPQKLHLSSASEGNPTVTTKLEPRLYTNRTEAVLCYHTKNSEETMVASDEVPDWFHLTPLAHPVPFPPTQIQTKQTWRGAPTNWKCNDIHTVGFILMHFIQSDLRVEMNEFHTAVQVKHETE